MTKFRTTILAILSIFAVSSCNLLEFDETDALKDVEEMYQYFYQSGRMLTNVYSYIPQPRTFRGNSGINDVALHDCASDDAEFGNIRAGVQNVNNGSWSAKNTFDSRWDLYNGIRAANNFIKDIQNVDFSRFEHDGRYENWMAQLKYYKDEARVLRAYFFFELARRYGDIAMPLTALTATEANEIEKTPFQDVINFIVTECDEAAKVLPVTYATVPEQEIGRITKGFAMALKSKALLYAASPLHNQNNDTNLWKKSADAALDLIESGYYQLDPAGCINNLESPENVLMCSNVNQSTYEQFNFPLRFTEGQRTANYINWTNFPTQNLVDAFETTNGYKVYLEGDGFKSDDPEFDPQSPFSGRDPRFYRTILADGMTFKGEKIDVSEGGLDDQIVSLGGSPTGYFLRKFIQENTSFVPGKNVSEKHHWVIYRYAETLLTYAESMINAFGDAQYTDAAHPYSALWALNQIRANAGMPEIANCPKNEFLKKLQNEWRVEFAFEDHRFWDVRRWKIGSDTQRTIYGVKIKKAADGNRKYYRQVYENRKWKDAMNLYPIPQEELFKNKNLSPQNIGW